MNSVLKAAKINVLPVYLNLYEKFLKNNSMKGMLEAGMNAGSDAPSSENSAQEPTTEKSAPNKKAAPVEEESDDEMGFGLFD